MKYMVTPYILFFFVANSVVMSALKNSTKQTSPTPPPTSTEQKHRGFESRGYSYFESRYTAIWERKRR